MTSKDAGGSGEIHEQIASTLDTIADLYDRLDSLSRQQRVLIADQKLDELLAVLKQRDELIDQLERVSPEYQHAIEQLTNLASTFSEQSRQTLGKQVAAIETVATQIAKRDQQASRMLDQRKAELATEMSGIGQKAAAATAYAGGKQQTPPPRFQDREG
jgi:chromosome segregation ATPase